MGGSALLIYGTPSDALQQPRPAPRTFMDRLTGRTRVDSPAWSECGAGRRMIDLPTHGLENLAGTFRDYVAARLNPPWKATASILEYLRMDVINFYVRGDASGDRAPEWYVQVTFGGCGGMAEVSAELATHWATEWYKAERTGVEARLQAYGFEPNGRINPDPSGAIFLPVGAAGYGLYQSTPRDDDEDYAESRYLEIDAAAIETLDEGTRAEELGKLDKGVGALQPIDSCRCQFCAPHFDVARLDRVAPFG